MSRGNGDAQLSFAVETPAPEVAAASRASGWGGRRRGAGRRLEAGKLASPPHRARAPIHSRRPVHVTMRAVVSELRAERPFAAISGALSVFARRARRAALLGAREGGFRIVQFSVQANHVHLVVEAEDTRAFRAGMGGLAVSIARRVNGVLSRKGALWRARFHARTLASPRAVRHALVYVLQNARKHGAPAEPLDACSSAPTFDGWRRDAYWQRVTEGTPPASLRATAPVVSKPETWLALVGWLRAGGPIGLDECPAAATRP